MATTAVMIAAAATSELRGPRSGCSRPPASAAPVGTGGGAAGRAGSGRAVQGCAVAARRGRGWGRNRQQGQGSGELLLEGQLSLAQRRELVAAVEAVIP